MPAPPPHVLPNARTAAIGLPLLLLVLFVAGGWWCVQHVRALPSVIVAPPASIHATLVKPVPAVAPGRLPSDEAGPLWTTLNQSQQEALRPLEPHWSTLTEAQKQRWIAIAARFPRLSPARKTTIQRNMTAWANLSPQERSRARLNYAASKKISAPVRKEQWEAYQALSQEEKKELAARAAPPPQGAATVVRPAPARKFARVPATSRVPVAVPNPPKIVPQVETGIPPSTAPEPHPQTEPAVVETTPIQTPSATAIPLPPLPPEPDQADTPPDAPTGSVTSEHPISGEP